MKNGGVMSFQPTPIIHPEKPTNDGRRFVVIIQPCDIATSGSIILTLRSHLVNTLSIPFVFVQCCKIQTNVACANKSYTQTGGQVGKFMKYMKI
jgi:hypothetical protein